MSSLQPWELTIVVGSSIVAVGIVSYVVVVCRKRAVVDEEEGAIPRKTVDGQRSSSLRTSSRIQPKLRQAQAYDDRKSGVRTISSV